jgi:hypothetical protein
MLESVDPRKYFPGSEKWVVLLMVLLLSMLRGARVMAAAVG